MIYHMLPATEWQSTRTGAQFAPDSLRTEGFIHFSASADQLLRVANTLYRGSGAPWVILVVDEERLHATVRWEGDGAEKFPHLYGPLNLDAVAGVRPFRQSESGLFETPDLP